MAALSRQAWVMAFAAITILIALYITYEQLSRARTKVSELGRYHGFSAADYDGSERRSDYLTLTDGRRLAYDLILPTRNGIVAEQRLPVLFKYTPYLRRFTVFDGTGKNIIADLFNLGWKERSALRLRYWFSKRSRFMDALDRDPWLATMVKHGYAVVVVEMPGTGASFGRGGSTFAASARDASEIIDWIAAQPWSDGKIGMYGDSWQGQTQFAAASTGNPHLKAIFPVATFFDQYISVIYAGGVYNKAFGQFFEWSLRFLDSNIVTPVDQDIGGALLAEARRERRGATAGEILTADFFRNAPFRDSIISDGARLWAAMAIEQALGKLNQAHVPTYLVAGWYDLFPRDMLLLFANLSVPKRLLIRPLDHSEIGKSQSDLDLAAEAQRWFDYWLKGIENGIMDEPPIHYYLMGDRRPEAWRTSTKWPPTSEQLTRFYFDDAALVSEAPVSPRASDRYTIDWTTTSGKHARWTAVNWPRDYPDMAANDAKSLAYTTPRLAQDMVLAGHPVVHLWLATEAADLDAFVYLEELDGNGKSIYITEGNLRASHRKLSEAHFDNLGLPYHAHMQADVAPLRSNEPVELVFDLLPIAYRFHKGSRVRVTIAFADADNFETPVLAQPPMVHVLRSAGYPSSIELPIHKDKELDQRPTRVVTFAQAPNRRPE